MTPSQDRDIWERHGFERDLGAKIINSYVYVGVSLLFLIPILAFSILPSIPVLFLISLVYEINFPYNLIIQIPIQIFMLVKIWKWLEKK